MALLRAILLTLNQSAIPNETPTVPPIQQNPPNEVVTVTGLLYASLLISLLAAFVAMLGKQWLNRYLRHAGGSMIERCGDRQRKLAGVEKWPLHFFVESLPIMLQVALLLLACGLCRHMASTNGFVAGVLLSFTLLGVLFYLGIVIAGATSYECPFQTPASTTLRSVWVKIGPHLRPVATLVSVTLRNLADIVQRQLFRVVTRLPHLYIQHHLHSLLEIVQSTVLRLVLRLPWTGSHIRQHIHHPPLPTVRDSCSSISQEVAPWITRTDLITIQMSNKNDVQCVSWILRNITDQEALDTAIRLAGTIRWFEGGINVEPPYDLIVSAFKACFDLHKEVYPGLRDRAYYSGRAILWIHTLAMCKSKKLASTFPLPTSRYIASVLPHDLRHLLKVILSTALSTNGSFVSLLSIDPGSTSSHSQWISNVLLHLSWANQAALDFREIVWMGQETFPLDTMLNRLLAWCILLGSPVGEEALRVQDKS